MSDAETIQFVDSVTTALGNQYRGEERQKED